ncbi:hypothetical protein DFR58_1439 [Anaerobacterium chartisolvens]|uniref:Peptidase MA superfamily protein n=1 Tax=Anaerobacterium chartisolvens TaxID=1297424 RepID=A0A369AJH3_9FIRM|nr:hypothetical protein [Anaerobacterium chartisolvens]RCX08297.1 hypothetical protein DFR58_1439 [Anaerobacterium chartisolvens]
MCNQDGGICREETELKFYPRYNENEWPAEWIEEVGNYMHHSYRIISDYTPLSGLPEIIFVQKEYTVETLERVNLPEWVSAFTIEGTIYALFNDKNARWRSVIDHEMFHAGVNMFLGSKDDLPVWFNESIAYFVGNNYAVDAWSLCHYVVEHFNTVSGWIEKDHVLSHEHIGYEIVKSLGEYICKTYGANKIKCLIEEMKKANYFNTALHKVFNIDVPTLVKGWRDNLLQICYT